MPYYAATGGDPAALLVGILSMVILLIVSGILINLKVKEFKIQVILYIMILIQLIIVFIDNYITVFPLMGFDPRAFEGLAWFSYINNVNVGRGEYNYYVLNPIYKLLKVRAATVFGVINIFANLLTNINMYEICKRLNIRKKSLYFLLLIIILSPISLIFRSGILRESIIIMFISFSLKSFINFCIEKNIFDILKAFIYIVLGSIFHGGVIFIGFGYFIGLFGGKKNQKVFQIIFLFLSVIVFIIFKDQLLESVGGGDIDKAVRLADIYSSLSDSGSGYLRGIQTESLGQIVMYLPLLMFYFLYSPTPELFRGILDIATFSLNSTIFICFTIGSYYYYKKIRKSLTQIERKIIKCIFISALLTTMVFSVGTRNSGTAIRHRDKVLPLLATIFIISKNKSDILKERRKYDRTTY